MNFNKHKKFFAVIAISLILIILSFGCECIEDAFDNPPEEEPTLAVLAITSGDLIGTTTLENFECKHWANLWGVAYSSCNVDVFFEDGQTAGGNILVRTSFVDSLPDIAYTTFDMGLNKLPHWNTKPISSVSIPDSNGIVTYFAENIRPKICDPLDPLLCQHFTDAIIQPMETNELDGSAIVGADRIWITW